MIAKFHKVETFLAAIEAAIKAGLTFEAYECAIDDLYVIEYDGGY